MSTRRPVASPRSHALPTLVALLAAGVAVEASASDAWAQTPPADGGVRPHHPPRPPHPIPPPAGGIAPVHPHPLPPPPPPPPPPPIQVEGGAGKVGP